MIQDSGLRGLLVAQLYSRIHIGRWDTVESLYNFYWLQYGGVGHVLRLGVNQATADWVWQSTHEGYGSLLPML